VTGYDVTPEVTEDYFQVVLSPPSGENEESLQSWEFRCDTLQELDEWVQAFQTAVTIDA
jgi:hypothetical protein